LIADELNVKKVRLLDAATEAVSHSIKPLPKQLGQKFGNKFPSLQKALLALDAELAAPRFLEGDTVNVEAGGETYAVEAGDVEIKAQAKQGFSVAEEGAYVAALVTALTPELVQEGRAREFVRRVQDLRKAANLDVADRIRLFVAASDTLKSAFEAHKVYVTAETLATSLDYGELPAGMSHVDEPLDGEPLRVALLKA
jgi:isoleucyl-tRNA synthetase